MVAAFSFEDLYKGLCPFSAPSTFSLTPFSELAHGVWYPEGGMYPVVEVLTQMADEADVVVANADLAYVYRHLLPDRGAADALARRTSSGSAISFFWGTDKRYPQIVPHTLFLADDYRGNFDRIERNLPLPDRPSLYVHAPARLDPGTAPAGRDTIVAVVPTGHMTYTGDDPERVARERESWAVARDRARDAVLNRLALLGADDVADHIVVEATAAPVTWLERFNLTHGATHGRLAAERVLDDLGMSRMVGGDHPARRSER